MTCGTFKMTAIPDGYQDAVENGFKTGKPQPTSVTKTKNADNTWTVVAVFPPCPPNTSHTTA
jgi:hypothetical protein